jgi:hypothetical protein
VHAFGKNPSEKKFLYLFGEKIEVPFFDGLILMWIVAAFTSLFHFPNFTIDIQRKLCRMGECKF